VCKLWSKKFAAEGGGTLADTYFDDDPWMCPKCDPCYTKRAAKRAVKLVGKEKKEEEGEEEVEVEEEEMAMSTATKGVRQQGKKKERAHLASGCYGVSANGKRWQAKIGYGGKKRYLGTFDTKQEAALAYDKEARKSGGENTLLNYDTIEEAEEAAVQARVEYGPSRQRARPASGYYGVCADGKSGVRGWKAAIYYGCKRHHLGIFDTRQGAALAYDKEARKSGGENTLLNYDTIEEAEEAAAQARVEYGPARQRARPASGYYGVRVHGSKRCRAIIRYDGKDHHLGSFDTKQEAALVYDKEVRKRGREGENQLLNYDTIEEAEEAAAQARVEYGPSRQRARPPSGYYGVHAKGKLWQAKIMFGGETHHLGPFDTKQEAALAYDTEARTSGGRKHMLNYDTIAEAEESAVKARAVHTLAKTPRARTSTA
jgi:hypothetical protein